MGEDETDGRKIIFYNAKQLFTSLQITSSCFKRLFKLVTLLWPTHFWNVNLIWTV